MLDPVLAADGYTYERAIIAAWFDAGNRTSPRPPYQAIEDRTLVPNVRIKEATEALLKWRQLGTPGDVRHWLRPAIAALGGQNKPLREPMTLSEGTTVEAAELPKLFEENRLRSPYTDQIWRRYHEQPRPNRALQALSAAVMGFVPPDFPQSTTFTTWTDPVLELPDESTRRAYDKFCCDYTGYSLTWLLTCGPMAGCGAAISTVLLTSVSCGAGFGIFAGACLGTTAIVRTFDYPYYLAAQDEAEQHYQEDCQEAWQRYNAHRAQVGLPPEQVTMTRDNHLAPEAQV